MKLDPVRRKATSAQLSKVLFQIETTEHDRRKLKVYLK